VSRGLDVRPGEAMFAAGGIAGAMSRRAEPLPALAACLLLSASSPEGCGAEGDETSGVADGLVMATPNESGVPLGWSRWRRSSRAPTLERAPKRRQRWLALYKRATESNVCALVIDPNAHSHTIVRCPPRWAYSHITETCTPWEESDLWASQPDGRPA
jgi:hypothetical protein